VIKNPRSFEVLPMKSMEKILENKEINSWIRHFSRSPHQIHDPHQADAELIEIKSDGSHLLAVTIDTISDEITAGLYHDPFTMGWVTVMSNFSDLAAVGADPVGIVTAVSLELERDEKFREGLASGIAEACRKLGVFILGGDINTTRTISLTGCAIGLVPRNEKMIRVGCQVGDVVFLSGSAGWGNALGLVRLSTLPEEYFPEELYRPRARIKEGQLIRRYATCCMDTSDGLLITLDQLLRLNSLGFIIEVDWKKILAEDVYLLCEKTAIPHWFMAGGIHGEFELVFTVPSEKVRSFLQAAEHIDFYPIQLGVIQQKPELTLALPTGKKADIDMTPLRNLWASGGTDLSRLMQEHYACGRKWGLE